MGRQSSFQSRKLQNKAVPPQASKQSADRQVSTPSRSDEVEAPRTPNLSHSRQSPVVCSGTTSPEVATLCPQPRRAFPGTIPAILGQPDAPNSPWSEADDSDCCEELRELLTGSKRLTIPESRPQSSVSTNAGPTPSLDDRLSPPFFWGSPSNSSTPALQEPPNAPKAVAPSRERKVFVGGIPQEMAQDDLFAFFSEHAPVKKAWLQKHRSAQEGNFQQRNHRGFGFVIFCDGAAVDDLLGGNLSCYVTLKDGQRLEIKRAMTSNDIQNAAFGKQDNPDMQTTQHINPHAEKQRHLQAEQSQASSAQQTQPRKQEGSIPRLQTPPPVNAASCMANTQSCSFQSPLSGQQHTLKSTSEPNVVHSSTLASQVSQIQSTCWVSGRSSPVFWHSNQSALMAPQPVMMTPMAWSALDQQQGKVHTPGPLQNTQPQQIICGLPFAHMTQPMNAWVQRCDSPPLPMMSVQGFPAGSAFDASLLAGRLSPVPEYSQPSSFQGSLGWNQQASETQASVYANMSQHLPAQSPSDCASEHPAVTLAKRAGMLGPEQQPESVETVKRNLASMLMSAMPDYYAE